MCSFYSYVEIILVKVNYFQNDPVKLEQNCKPLRSPLPACTSQCPVVQMLEVPPCHWHASQLFGALKSALSVELGLVVSTDNMLE